VSLLLKIGLTRIRAWTQDALSAYIKIDFEWALSGGVVELSSLELKPDIIPAHLPIFLKCGYIGKLRVEVPLFNLTSKPVKVDIDTLVIMLGQCTAEQQSEEDVIAEYTQAKRDAIHAAEAAEAANAETTAGGAQQAEEDSSGGSSFIGRLLEKIQANIDIRIRNVHIRYAERVAGAPIGVGNSTGLRLDEMHLSTTDLHWSPAGTLGGNTIPKLLIVHGPQFQPKSPPERHTGTVRCRACSS